MNNEELKRHYINIENSVVEKALETGYLSFPWGRNKVKLNLIKTDLTGSPVFTYAFKGKIVIKKKGFYMEAITLGMWEQDLTVYFRDNTHPSLCLGYYLSEGFTVDILDIQPEFDF